MKKTLFLLIAFIALTFIPAVAPAQSTYEIFRTACRGSGPSPIRPSVVVTPLGDIDITPCAGRTVNINGAPAIGITSLNGLTALTQTFATSASDTFSIVSSGSLHTFRSPVTGISGTSRTGFVPYFTGQNTFGKMPMSWDGTTYNWRNTSLNNTFQMEFSPSSTTGLFTVGASGSSLTIDQDAATVQAQGDVITLATTATGQINADAPDGTVTIGDVSGGGASTKLVVDDSAQLINLGASFIHLEAATPNSIVVTDSALNLDYKPLADGQLLIGAGGSAPAAANLTAGTNISILNSPGGVSIGVGTVTVPLTLDRTITAIGTTGNVTINKVAGTVNIAPAASSAVVTNNLVTPSSIIMVTARTNDTTCAVKNYVAGASSITVNMTAACTAATSVGFIVTN